MSFSIQRILSETDVKDMLELLENGLETEFKDRYYNLFNVEYSHVFSRYHDFSMFTKLNDSVNRKVRNHYILKYNVGSYTKIHQDNEYSAKKTIVTLLNKSHDLDGGECIFYDDNVPHVVNLNVGESIIYDQNMFHGVGIVRKGHRTVCVSWYY